MDDTAQKVGDAAAVIVAFGALAEILPPIAALISVAWVLFQFWHHPAVVEWRAKWRR